MNEKEKSKELYEKPSLRVIELTAEEIMGVCKTLGGGPGPLRPVCALCSQQFSSS